MLLEFIGKIYKGVKSGEGKLYNIDGSIRYEGYFSNGGPHGENCKIYGPKRIVEYIGPMIEKSPTPDKIVLLISLLIVMPWFIDS